MITHIRANGSFLVKCWGLIATHITTIEAR